MTAGVPTAVSGAIISVASCNHPLVLASSLIYRQRVSPFVVSLPCCYTVTLLQLLILPFHRSNNCVMLNQIPCLIVIPLGLSRG